MDINSMDDEHLIANTVTNEAFYHFACLTSRTFSAKEQCFSLTTNQRMVLFSFLFSEANREESNSLS